MIFVYTAIDCPCPETAYWMAAPTVCERPDQFPLHSTRDSHMPQFSHDSFGRFQRVHHQMNVVGSDVRGSLRPAFERARFTDC